MRRAAPLAAMLLWLPAMAVAEPPVGTPPTFSDRQLTPVPNEAAFIRRAWAPDLDEGYIPQGLTVAEGTPILAAYREGGGSAGRCRLFRLDPASGATTARYDVPGRCGHAGGLAYAGEGRLFVADTSTLIELDLARIFRPGAGAEAEVRRMSLRFPLRGSFLAYRDGALWIGTYSRPQPGILYRLPLARLPGVADPPGLTEADTDGSLTVAALSQGAAFDTRGRLWLTQSNSQFGRIQVVDPASGIVAQYDAPAGIEDIGFAPDGTLWTAVEAGTKRWHNWPTFYPLVLQIDPEKLR